MVHVLENFTIAAFIANALSLSLGLMAELNLQPLFKSLSLSLGVRQAATHEREKYLAPRCLLLYKLLSEECIKFSRLFLPFAKEEIPFWLRARRN
jgi:hypothetical protein